MPVAKTAQLQIRVSPRQKEAIQRAARRAGMEMSAYVLATVLPPAERRFQELATACRDSDRARFALAEMNSWLADLGADELAEAVASPLPEMALYWANYIAATVEYACARRGIAPPAWTVAIAPLTEPVFGSTLFTLRLYLLGHSPPPFRRRNIFIDSTVGAAV
jgi:uncharacterized protein (DUF1778 family)